jgi:hypothetical protein
LRTTVKMAEFLDPSSRKRKLDLTEKDDESKVPVTFGLFAHDDHGKDGGNDSANEMEKRAMVDAEADAKADAEARRAEEAKFVASHERRWRRSKKEFDDNEFVNRFINQGRDSPNS